MGDMDTIYVEDDEQEAFIMRVGMRRQGITILHVPNITPDSIAALREPPYDTAAAVIFDAILSGQSGIDLALRLRSSGDERLIVLLTAADNPDPELLRKHNIQYMRKPPSFESLARAIHEHAGT
jgi:DNA-binding response OmpR family regulator